MDQSSLLSQQYSSCDQLLMSSQDHHHLFNDLQLPHFTSADPHQSFTISPQSNLYSTPNMQTPSVINCTMSRPRKIQKMISWSTNSPGEAIKEETMMTIGGIHSDDYGFDLKYQIYDQDQGRKRNTISNNNKSLRMASSDEHIMAERKRREKLSQRFIALAAVIPGLKKTDKASVLSDAIRYVKELEGTLKFLENKNMKKMVESAVLLKRSKISIDDNANSTDDEKRKQNTSDQNLTPEIEVKVCEKTVLVKIHCEKHKGLLVKILSEIEKFHLMVTNTSVIPFVESFLDITVTAQMEEGFVMKVKDLVKEIKVVISEFNN